MSNYSKWSPIAKLVEKNQWPPYERDSDKWFKFIEEQKEIFRKGYQIGSERITGPHYWKLNFCKILILDSRKNKVPTLPFISDRQREFYEQVEDSLERTLENILGLKGRDKGWTYDVAALCLYYTQNEEFSSIMGLFPGGTSVAKSNFRAAYDLAYNQLDIDFKHPTIKSTEGKNIEQLRYGVQTYEINPKTGKPTGMPKTEGIQSKLDMMILTSPSVVRSGRNKIIVIEEVGEMDEFEELVDVADANLKQGAEKFGIMIAGGTSNMIKTGVTGFKKEWYNPKSSFKKIFIPAYDSCWGFVDYQTGKSDQEGAKQYHEEERAKRTGDKLRTYIQENPFNPEEAFFEGVDSPYNVDLVNKQINRILSDKSISSAIQTGNFYPKKENGIIKPVWEIEPSGRWQIFKHPDNTLKYKIVGGLDSYKLGQATDSNSKGAIEFYVPFQGMNTPGDYPAAVYWDRPKEKEVFYMDSLLATMYYDTQLLVELTEEDIVMWYKTHNGLKYLKERPSIIKTMYSKAENKYGVLPTAHNKSMALEYSVKIFNGNYDQIVFIELLREMLKLGTENVDRVDAHHWAVLHAMDNMKVLDEYKKPVKERAFHPYTAMDSAGKLVVINSPQQEKNYGLSGNEKDILTLHEKLKRYESKFAT